MIENTNEIIGQIADTNKLVGELNNEIILIGGLETTNELIGELSNDNNIVGEIQTTNELSGEIEPINEILCEVSMNTGGGTLNYDYLYNKPKINNIELVQNKTLDDLGIQEKGEYPSESLSNSDIESILSGFVG